jgi:hypothetical protein
MNEEKRTARESLFAEILMSIIVALSVQSLLMFIRGFNENVTITTYPQLIPLILVVIHTLIRRKWPNLVPFFFLHIISSAAFFCAVVFFPGSEYGSNVSNMIYLGVTVIALMISSFSYRLNPRIQPSDSEVAAIPASVFPICGLFYAMMERPDLVANLITNTLLAMVLYLVMRQVAVFDTKYYHSIRSSSRPASHLKKQNYKTAAGLVGIFALSLIVLKFIPVESLTQIVFDGLKALIRILIPLFLALLDFLEQLVKGANGDQEPSEDLIMPEDLSSSEPWLRVLSTIFAVLILIGMILLIINTIRLLILNAPKYGKEKESSNDGIVTDTIELLDPDRKPFFRKRQDFGKGYERRIRKQFYEKTSNAMRKGLPVSASSTPGQIEKVLSAHGDKDIASLRQEYEKVRYGK